MMKKLLNRLAVLCLAAFIGQGPETSAKQETSPGSETSPGPDASATQETSEKVFVILRALDKVTARTTELPIEIGSERTYGSLVIKPRYCRTRSPLETPETFAYLAITDKPAGRAGRVVFNGWMLASSPALNPLEHPVYDVWVLACKTASGDNFTGPDDQLPDF